MFLQLNHQKLEVYKTSRKLNGECYKLTQKFPTEEKFNMVSQIRRAALSVHLNLAEGSSRRSVLERKRYFEISRGSLIEIDAALDIASDLKYFKPEECGLLGELMNNAFSLFTGLINASKCMEISHQKFKNF